MVKRAVSFCSQFSLKLRRLNKMDVPDNPEKRTNLNGKEINRGFILLLVMVLSLIVMTAISVWYRQVVLQSFLSERLISQKALYRECWSLVPSLKEKLEELEDSDLETTQDDFYDLTIEGEKVWSISRSAVTGGMIYFVFKNSDLSIEPIVLSVLYSRTEF